MNKFKHYMSIIQEMVDSEITKNNLTSEKQLLSKMIQKINSLNMFEISEGFKPSDLKKDTNYLYFKDKTDEFIIAKFCLITNSDDTEDLEYYYFYYDIDGKFVFGQERDPEDAFYKLSELNIDIIKNNEEKIKELDAVEVINND